jgi:hypothetical protein
MKHLLRVVLGLSLLASASGTDQNQAIPASLIQLIAAPENFDGKLVLVQGFFACCWEGAVLWVHEEDSKNLLASNAIWIDPSEEMERDQEKLNRMYVRLEGVFHAGHEQHPSFFNGGIAQIRTCTKWSNPAHPIALEPQSYIQDFKKDAIKDVKKK